MCQSCEQQLIHGSLYVYMHVQVSGAQLFSFNFPDVQADETPAFDVVLKADTKRMELLEQVCNTGCIYCLEMTIHTDVQNKLHCMWF